jgi:hypothetical protein
MRNASGMPQDERISIHWQDRSGEGARTGQARAHVLPGMLGNRIIPVEFNVN